MNRKSRCYLYHMLVCFFLSQQCYLCTKSYSFVQCKHVSGNQMCYCTFSRYKMFHKDTLSAIPAARLKSSRYRIFWLLSVSMFLMFSRFFSEAIEKQVLHTLRSSAKINVCNVANTSMHYTGHAFKGELPAGHGRATSSPQTQFRASWPQN